MDPPLYQRPRIGHDGSNGYTKNGKPFLTKEPKLLLNDDNAGKPEGIHLMIGRRPYAAFGNSTGDRQMLEYAKAGDGARLAMLVLHDDATREYAYGPAQGLPATKVGAFPQALYDEAKQQGWVAFVVDRASNVQPGDVMLGMGPDGGQGEAGTRAFRYWETPWSTQRGGLSNGPDSGTRGERWSPPS